MIYILSCKKKMFVCRWDDVTRFISFACACACAHWLHVEMAVACWFLIGAKFDWAVVGRWGVDGSQCSGNKSWHLQDHHLKQCIVHLPIPTFLFSPFVHLPSDLLTIPARPDAPTGPIPANIFLVQSSRKALFDSSPTVPNIFGGSYLSCER